MFVARTFWVKIVKGILFGVWDLLQDSPQSEKYLLCEGKSVINSVWLILPCV